MVAVANCISHAYIYELGAEMTIREFGFVVTGLITGLSIAVLFVLIVWGNR